MVPIPPNQEAAMTEPSFTAELEAPNLLVIEATGRMDAIGMEVALDMLVPILRQMSHGAMLMRAHDVSWPTLGAIGVELRHWAQLMAMVRKVDRVAVMTDQGWLKNAAAVESLLVPNLEIRSFAPTDEAAARDWLAAVTGPKPA
jgi:SpoIIAA-like